MEGFDHFDDEEIMDNVQENLYKVLVIGEYGVGKSTINQN